MTALAATLVILHRIRTPHLIPAIRVARCSLDLAGVTMREATRSAVVPKWQVCNLSALHEAIASLQHTAVVILLLHATVAGGMGLSHARLLITLRLRLTSLVF